ncbi:MAG: hypothetical protein ACI9DS_002909 [Glaciecola sp.]|jgi:hypothetical protein
MSDIHLKRRFTYQLGNFMKYTLLVASLIFVTSAFADDRPVADAEVIMEYKEYCKEIADEEGTGKPAMDQFLLTCINDELESEGFQPITKLPK